MLKSNLFKKSLASFLLILGIFCIGLSSYIRSEVEDGEARLESGKQKLNQGKSALAILPRSQMLQNQLQEAGQKKIHAGEEQIAYYSHMATLLLIGGILLSVGGVVLLVLKKK